MRALSRAANSPGYPLTAGTAELRDGDCVLPDATLGSRRTGSG